MKNFRKAYYEFKAEADRHFEGLREPIHAYVEALEQINSEMLKILKEEYLSMCGNCPAEIKNFCNSITICTNKKNIKSIIQKATE